MRLAEVPCVWMPRTRPAMTRLSDFNRTHACLDLALTEPPTALIVARPRHGMAAVNTVGTILITAMVGLAVLAGAAIAGDPAADLRRAAESGWPFEEGPSGMFVLPVLDSDTGHEALPTLLVCTREGVRPRRFAQLHRGCASDAETCTAYVGVLRGDALLITDYQAENPWVVVQDDSVCTGPTRRPTGVLAARAGN